MEEVRTVAGADMEQGAGGENESYTRGDSNKEGSTVDRVDIGGDSQFSPQASGTSLLTQFPPTQEMTRAITQSPIPLPPTGQRQQETREDGAMQMSPPVMAP